MHFPSWRYHRTEPACIVHDPIEDEALGEGWADTPAAFEGDEPAIDEDLDDEANDGDPAAAELTEDKKAKKRAADKARRDAKKAAAAAE